LSLNDHMIILSNYLLMFLNSIDMTFIPTLYT